MGGGSYSRDSFKSYSESVNKLYDDSTGRISNQVWKSEHLKEILNPKGKIRECANSKEHPNTIPVIIGLDVTGSMGSACQETAETLGVIMEKLYESYKDIEVCVMGIGDFECDDAPLQVSQFESDVRVAQQLDELWMEKGGGGNNYESYTAPWYYGLYRTKLDAYDKQGRKGIIITMGDEPLNPDLPVNRMRDYLGLEQVGKIDTKELYEEASKKFDIFHISIDSNDNCYKRYKERVDPSFKSVIGESNYKVSTINALSNTICDCIDQALKAPKHLTEDTNGDIVW